MLSSASFGVLFVCTNLDISAFISPIGWLGVDLLFHHCGSQSDWTEPSVEDYGGTRSRCSWRCVNAMCCNKIEIEENLLAVPSYQYIWTCVICLFFFAV